MSVFVFDLDGVIRYWDNPNIVGEAERDHGLPGGAIFAAAFADDLLTKVTTGVITDDEWRADVVRRLQARYPEADPASAVERWSRPCGELLPGSVEILERVRQYGPVCLLTNATSRLADDLNALGIAGHFDHVFNSSEIGYAKPDPRVFEHVERQVNARPGEIVYVDDGPANVEAAARRGWCSLLASPAASLAELVTPLLDDRLPG